MARLASESNQMCHELRALVFLTSVPEAVDRGSWFWPMSQIGQHRSFACTAIQTLERRFQVAQRPFISDRLRST